MMKNKIWLKEITIYVIIKRMDFNTETENKYYHDIYNNKYYEIVKAKQYGKHLVDIKAKECEIKFIEKTTVPKNNFQNKETMEQYTSELKSIGRVKKIPNCDLLEVDNLKDKYIIKTFN